MRRSVGRLYRATRCHIPEEITFVVDLIIIDLTVNIVEIVLGISQLVLTVCLRPIKCHLLCSARCQIYKESVRKTSLFFTMKMATLIFTETSGNIYSSERHNH